MTPSATSEFGLSRSRDEIYCDWDGAFIASVPLLQKNITDGGHFFEARDLNSLSGEIADRFGLPIDLSSKAKGLNAIACALKERNLARAQLLTIFLRFPTPPISSGHGISKAAATEFVSALRANGLLKAWDPDQHPRWPALAPDSQGGQFAPKDSGVQVADNLSSGPVCRETAVAGCLTGITVTAPEGAVAGCATTGPGCPVGGTVGAAVTAIGSCIAGGIAGYEACSSVNQSRSDRPANPDRPSDRAIRDQCIAQCSDLLERPEGRKNWGTNEPDFHRCLADCIKEKRTYWGN